MSSGTSTSSKTPTSTGKPEKKGEIQFTAELEEILKRITEIKNIAGFIVTVDCLHIEHGSQPSFSKLCFKNKIWVTPNTKIIL